jgi:thiamine biosynthesis lipoprotein
MPLLPGASRSAAPAGPELLRWRGRALGAMSTITLAHPDTLVLRRTLAHCVNEIRRLEGVFSLFEPGSELRRLNRDGRLAASSLDLRIVLAEAHRISTFTDGAFDVTVQPLWTVFSTHFRRHPDDAAGPSRRDIERARGLVDYRMLETGAGNIAFARHGMAATLNGIAQGYVTDRIGAILHSEGFGRVLVDVGEIAALAPPGENKPWRVAVEDPDHTGRHTARLALSNQAVATSRGAATRFDTAGRHHHLFDPSTGRSAAARGSVTVVANSAMTADALSTALAVSQNPPNPALLRACGAERALILDGRGKRTWIGEN